MQNKFNYETLVSLVSKAKKDIVNNHISNITLINANDILFTFSFYRKEKLLVSLNHNNPFISFINVETNIPTVNNKLTETLRQKVKDSKISKIEILNEDRIIKISLEKTNELYEVSHLSLILELIPHRQNLLLLNEEDKITYANHLSNIDEERLILLGNVYSLPNKNEYQKKEAIDLSSFKQEANQYVLDAINIRNIDKYKAFGKSIKTRIESNKRKIKKLEEEILINQNKLIYQEYGNICLTYIDDLSSLNDYVLINNVPFDNNKSINENANNFFKIYKKAKASIAHSKEEINKTQKEIGILENEYQIYLSNDEYSLQQLQNKYPNLIPKIKLNPINKNKPYFVEYDGYKIAYGKNNEQNDYLTFKLANDFDTFLHIKDYKGSHVVILNKNPTNEVLEIASQIALLASGKDIGEINYALIKDIKKGHNGGQVILSNYQTITIKYKKEEIKDLFKKSKRLL